MLSNRQSWDLHSPIPDNLMPSRCCITAHKEKNFKKRNKNKLSIIRLAIQYLWLNGTSSTLTVCTFPQKEEPDFQHSLGKELSDRETEKALKETFHQQPSQMSAIASSSLSCLACGPSPGAAVSSAKSTCPAPSFSCPEFMATALSCPDTQQLTTTAPDPAPLLHPALPVPQPPLRVGSARARQGKEHVCEVSPCPSSSRDVPEHSAPTRTLRGTPLRSQQPTLGWGSLARGDFSGHWPKEAHPQGGC